ncbi:HlyD family type I secretion periplasmic adaptor subunit [Methylopila turkensis]|uniref:Membrane fusion protein (MFP) family protein n=1 Tax=Methylopila turkensis TaxID=1437816 RepID=A0A9W6JQK3_9HYPH|nr:HlyD family type I secretion periplasmic adaptor subunit [Methylopila turkensis]GLK80583.1 HlyD family type I secretion periplasmic adaptor subunit [Methylopila turkensis]
MTAPRDASLAVRLRGVALAGFVVIFGFMGGFAVWAMTAPLAAGAVVRGAVGPEGSRKLAQHLEGGIVREIFVKDGDLVTRGQPLVTLERAQAQAAYGLQRNTLSRRLAEAARLSAQLSGAETADFGPAAAVAKDDPTFPDFASGQRALFETTRRDQDERKELFETQIRRLGAQIEAARARIAGSEAQRALVDIQIDDTRGLMEKGLARKPLLLDLQRRRSELDTDIAAMQADIRRAEIESVEKRIALRNGVTSYLNDTSAELAKARSEIAGLEARLSASEDVLTRTQVLAPETGYVLNLKTKTIGGVVRPGDEILEIVPTEGDLIIEGRVAAHDIRNIAAGQRARVSFLTFAQRDMPMIEGRVINVAADIVTDPQTRESFYTVKVAVDRADFATFATPADMKPGTPVEAYVEARKRMAMDYLLDPIVHSFRKSFREE